MIQDEFTNRADLTATQKYQLRHHPYRGSGIQGVGSLLAKTERTNLGLALVQLVAIPGVPLSLDDIAAWCDCSRQAIENIERRALLKLRNALMFRDPALWNDLRAHLDLFAERTTARHRITRHAA